LRRGVVIGSGIVDVLVRDGQENLFDGVDLPWFRSFLGFDRSHGWDLHKGSGE
jgi:hypothetical protein